MLVLLSIPGLQTVALAQGDRNTITSDKLVNEVTIDGRWTNQDEWKEASRHRLFFLGTGEGDLRVKDDENFLYVLIDYFTDLQREKGDFAGIILDTRHDFGDEPRPDDLMLQCTWNSDVEHGAGAVKWRGGNPQGLNWREVVQLPSGSEVDSSDDTSNNPVSIEPHMMYEFKIPRDLLGYPSIGFVAFTGDGQMGIATSTWPAGQLSKGNLFDDPSQWGELTFSTSPKQMASTRTTITGLEGTRTLERRRQLHTGPSQAWPCNNYRDSYSRFNVLIPFAMSYRWNPYEHSLRFV